MTAQERHTQAEQELIALTEARSYADSSVSQLVGTNHNRQLLDLAARDYLTMLDRAIEWKRETVAQRAEEAKAEWEATR